MTLATLSAEGSSGVVIPFHIQNMNVENGSAEISPQRWYAAYTNARHEKSVATQLAGRYVDCFLPLYKSARRWKDRRKVIDLPLFPGYIFVHMRLEERLKVLTVPGVVHIVSFRGLPAPVKDTEIEDLRKHLTSARLEPHPYLVAGRRVRVRSGPVAGLEGILARRKDRCRVVLSVELIMRSVAVEVDEADIELAA